MATKDAINRNRVDDLPWPRVEVRPIFYCRDSRRRDRDNLGASLKSAYDGLADAGLLTNDYYLIPMPPEVLVDRKDPRVELIINREEA